MNLTIREQSPAALLLADYGRVPIAFEVSRVLELSAPDGGLGGLRLAERRLDAPYVKDYDAIPDNGPAHWAARFDVSRWGVLAAHADEEHVGGAVVAFDTPGLDLLHGRRDLAVLWDLRVAPAHRGRGVGAALFRAAERWAASRGCWRMAIETQNVNVPACRFYARMGCTLAAMRRFAYDGLPEEVQLIWHAAL